MRRLMVVAAVLTAFSQSSTVAFGDSPPPRPRGPAIIYPQPPPPQMPRPYPQPDNNGLCRRAPDLPQLGLESQSGQNQGPTRWTPRSGGEPIPVPMAAPSPVVPATRESAAPRAAMGGVVMRDAAPATGASSADASRSGVAGSTSKRASAHVGGYSPPPPPPPSSGKRDQQVQSGQLTAGEHDDLLNPALYARYVTQFLAGETLSGVPRVDTGKALMVVVTDSSGAPMPFATVTLTCSDNNTLSLTTLADGRVAFFPDLDRLGTSVRMSATASNGGSAPVRTINVADVRGAQTVRTQISARAPRVAKFDLAVVIDATGSMGDEINFLKAELNDIIQTLSRRHRGLDIRVALVIYRDQGDEFVTRTFEFTTNMGQVQSNLNAQSAGGGGDMPEAMEVAMARAVGLNWRSDAIKSMLLVADAPPHSGDVPATWAATEAARAKRIQIVPVAASGVDDAAQYIMRAMAAATQSRYAFLTDDSGIGNAHAEPSVDCYHVTKLDSLVRRILDAQISGRRIEPDSNEILRTVGDYDNGRCRGA
jgi:Mg-chelatase subunit ChlD